MESSLNKEKTKSKRRKKKVSDREKQLDKLTALATRLSDEMQSLEEDTPGIVQPRQKLLVNAITIKHQKLAENCQQRNRKRTPTCLILIIATRTVKIMMDLQIQMSLLLLVCMICIIEHHRLLPLKITRS